MARWRSFPEPQTVWSLTVWEDGWLIGATNGLWHADASGVKPIADALRAVAITAVAVGKARLFVGASDGIAFSDDRGQTWTASALPRPAQVTQIALSPEFERDGVGFAATTNCGVLCTTDGGVSWSERNLGLVEREVIGVAFAAAAPVVFAAQPSGVFVSPILRQVWQPTRFPQDANPLVGLASAGSTLILASENDGVYYSQTLGASFFKRSAFSGGATRALAASPDQRLIALATPSVVALSRDAGESWMRAQGKVPPGILALAVRDDGAIACGTQRDGLWLYM